MTDNKCGLCRRERAGEDYYFVTGLSAYIICRECQDEADESNMDRVDFVRKFPHRVPYEG